MSQFHFDFDMDGANGEMYAKEFHCIAKKVYIDILESVNKDILVNRLESFHREFLTNNRNVKKRCGIKLVDENIYERRWIDDYNKLKIKLKKMC